MAYVDLVLTDQHPDFPIAVRAMVRPPERLYLRGSLPIGRAIGIVGTRRATTPALRFAHVLALEACRSGWSVYSGGASGIDTAAHLGALEAEGRTVVVMGTGFDHTYPAGNRNLFERVLEQGAWLSAYPAEQRGTKWSFLPRNELLAALVDDVVIVQSPGRSGARSTVAAARRMGKTVWAVPGSPWDPSSEGCLAEIQAGAKVLVNPSQLFGRRAPIRKKRPDMSRGEMAVFKAVKRSPASLDSICERSGLSFPEAAAAVLTLTLKQVLLESADGSYHVNR